VTPASRSVFYDLLPMAEAEELVMRSTLLRGPKHWLKESGLSQTRRLKRWALRRLGESGQKRGSSFSTGPRAPN
jgi:hypothetical protein